jgi:hypothetical protein
VGRKEDPHDYSDLSRQSVGRPQVPFTALLQQLALRRERVGLIPTPNGAFQVYFGQMYLGILEGGTARFNPNR